MSIQLHLLQSTLLHLKLIIYVTYITDMKAQKYYKSLSMNFYGKRTISIKKAKKARLMKFLLHPKNQI